MDAYQYQQQVHPYIVQQMRSQGYNPADPAHLTYFQRLLSAQQPIYVANHTGQPVNIANGGVRTEARGIFVNGLNYKAGEATISAHFSRAGTIIRVDLQRDHHTKKSQGKCVIRYDSAKSAQRAIRMFDKTTFLNMQLQVREDTDRVAVDAPDAGPAPAPQPAARNPMPPVIVSSTPTQNWRLATKSEGYRQ